MDVQKLNARQAPAQQGLEMFLRMRSVKGGASSSREACLPVWPCEWAVGGWCCGYRYEQRGAVRLARAPERAPSLGRNFELNPQNKGICGICEDVGREMCPVSARGTGKTGVFLPSHGRRRRC